MSGERRQGRAGRRLSPRTARPAAAAAGASPPAADSSSTEPAAAPGAASPTSPAPTDSGRRRRPGSALRGRGRLRPAGGAAGATPARRAASRSDRLAALATETGRRAAITGRSGRPGRTGRPGARRQREGEDEPARPFRRGISLGVKIAAFTASLVAVLMVVLGVYLYRIAARTIDQQINQSGIIAATEIATFIEPQILYDLGFKDRERFIAEWNRKLRDLVNDPEHDFLHIRVAPDPAASQPPIISSGDVPRVSHREIGRHGEVIIREGTYRGSEFQGRIRWFVVPIYARLAAEGEAGLGERLPAELGPEAADVVRRPIAYVHLFRKAAQIDEVKDETYLKVAWATALGIAMAVALSFLVSLYLVRPLKRLVEDMREVAAGNLDHRTVPRTSDELGLVAHQFDEMTRSLKAAQKLEQQRQQIENELNIATEIQTKLLPDRIPQIPGFDLFSFYLSAREVGGDYYDFLVIDQTRLGLVVADVSGKGIPGAMVMTMVRSLLRLASHREPSPAETLKKVNRILARDIRPGMFVTALYAVLDVHTRVLTVSSAGHSPLLHYEAAAGTCRQINPSGMALGFDKGRTFDDTIEEQAITLQPGDRILAYTDGVIEAMDENEREFGLERLTAFVREHAALSSKDFTNALVQALERHRGRAEQSDDITITTLRVE
ncbi:MAG: hypothetical protein KatS3mg102_1275 [Planctomycetota bacterium]|nr:MAG: hypothetical protein KatS3mg102_1275 [Planctomycetota bacterium]